jgi:hypothetical protein
LLCFSLGLKHQSRLFREYLFIVFHFELNRSFNTPWTYGRYEAQNGIDKSVCLRIVHQFWNENPEMSFTPFVKYCKSLELELVSILDELASRGTRCLVLCIDAVDKVKKRDETRFQELFSLIAKLSMYKKLFFIPILSGCAIGPMKNAV